jgi:hypothetical protein
MPKNFSFFTCCSAPTSRMVRVRDGYRSSNDIATCRDHRPSIESQAGRSLARAELQLQGNGFPVAFLELRRHHPGRNTRPGGDSLPDFLRRARDLEFYLEGTAPVGPFFTVMMSPWMRNF